MGRNERAREHERARERREHEGVEGSERILTDESFKIDIEPCKSAYKQAQDTMKWAMDDTNTSQINQFETAMLKRCLPQVIAGSSNALQGQRVDVWQKYHLLRTSPDFFHLWSEFLAAATGSLPEPSFFQEASDIIFRDLVTEVYPLPEAPAVNADQEITYTEANVVHYIAGYIQVFLLNEGDGKL